MCEIPDIASRFRDDSRGRPSVGGQAANWPHEIRVEMEGTTFLPVILEGPILLMCCDVRRKIIRRSAAEKLALQMIFSAGRMDTNRHRPSRRNQIRRTNAASLYGDRRLRRSCRSDERLRDLAHPTARLIRVRRVLEADSQRIREITSARLHRHHHTVWSAPHRVPVVCLALVRIHHPLAVHWRS